MNIKLFSTTRPCKGLDLAGYNSSAPFVDITIKRSYDVRFISNHGYSKTMQVPSIELIGRLMREFSTHAGNSPHKTPTGVEIASALTIHNLPHDIAPARFMKGMAADLDVHCPRAKTSQWSFTPSAKNEERYDLQISFARPVQETVIRPILARHMVRELQACGYDYKVVRMTCTNPFKPKDGHTPSAPR